MPLRVPNNPNYAAALLQAVIPILLGNPSVNTALALNSEDGTGKNQMYVRDLLSLSQGAFPAVNLRTGPQTFQRNSHGSWNGLITCIAEYYDVWDESPLTLPQIRADISADLELMKANLENADSLGLVGVAGSQRAVSVGRVALGDDKGIIDRDSVPGRVTVYNLLQWEVNILPYDA